MAGSLQNRKSLFKSGYTKQPNDKIVIGGADLSDMPSKELLIDQKVEEAKKKASEDGTKIIEDARKKAEQIIEAAHAQKDNILESAREEGYTAGHQEGMLVAKEELTESLKAGVDILKAIEQERQECIEDETNRIYKVICLIAQKLIKQDLAIKQELSLEFINQALKKLEYKSEVNLLINPAVARKINSLKAEIIDSCPGLEKLSITASEAIQPGDLILESNKERLDFRLDSQLEELVKEICK